MFSRSSSLTSLNSLVPPLPDGASSVVSTFSRVTSGVVSPSELPDSPTQTVPPSAGHSAEPSVFGDTCEPYKLEGTPIEFSRQTSLSCLSFDQVKIYLKRADFRLLITAQKKSVFMNDPLINFG